MVMGRRQGFTRILVCLLWVVACCGFLNTNRSAVAADKHPAFTDADSAGPDFAVQGEYIGHVGQQGFTLAVAAQVIALGNGKFEGVLYKGGLPGAGWDEKFRFHFKGETKDGITHAVGIHGEKLAFENPNLKATIQEGVMRGEALMFRNELPDTAFELKKIFRQSPTLGIKPPAGAIVLFDGSNTDEWVDGKIVENNLLDVGTQTKRQFNSHRVHLEFRTPFMPAAAGMSRGNSGVYIRKKWEIQVLDSFAWNSENRKFERLADFGCCGGIHEMVKPRLNMCLPPLSWQTYDIDFEAPKKDAAGKVLTPAMLTVHHNGICIHDRVVLAPYGPGEDSEAESFGKPGPLFLQQHGNPVRFRNIWAIVTD